MSRLSANNKITVSAFEKVICSQRQNMVSNLVA